MNGTTTAIYFNINGVQGNFGAVEDLIKDRQPDLICLQETKCSVKVAQSNVKERLGYETFACEARNSRDHGCAIYYKAEPIAKATHPNADMASEGRVLIMEYLSYYLVSIYLPHSGNSKEFLPSKIEWFNWLIDIAVRLKRRKPVVILGDLNYKSFYIGNDTRKKRRTVGFYVEEEAGFNILLNQGFTDILTYKYPTDEAMFKFLENKLSEEEILKGHRLDYILVSDELLPKIVSVDIHTQYGHDWHFPIEIEAVLQF